MSFRPTVSVYAGGRIADIRFYRNAPAETLLFSALELALEYRGVKTREEFLLRRYGAVSFDILLFPERIPNTEVGLKSLEAASELPILVDLASRSIYCSDRALSATELRRLPDLSREAWFFRLSAPDWEERFLSAIERGRIDLTRARP
ncbi:MAG: hypothetical protein IKG85_00565 [Clostridia bacterium]|nr:hypothetical protein [Clostridia bacterium]